MPERWNSPSTPLSSLSVVAAVTSVAICSGALGRFFQAVLIDVAIQQADEVKQFADGSSRVEVIVHLFQERGPFFATSSRAGDAAGIQLSGLAPLRGGQSEIALTGNPLEPFEEAIKGLQCHAGFCQGFVTEDDRAAIMGAEQEESQSFVRLGGESTRPVRRRLWSG